MDERYCVERYEQAAQLLPARWQKLALQLPDWEKVLAEELRMRAGQPMTVLLPEGERFLQQETPRMTVAQNDLEQLCDIVTGYSRYAVSDALRNGYLTAKGGFRIGFCGSAVLQDGRMTGLHDFSSAVIRIGRQHTGICEEVVMQLMDGGYFPSTLIYSPPGLGKTTLLRDMIRSLSDGAQSFAAHRVAVADERGEIAVMHHGRAQMFVGCHTDVLDNCPKALAIPILLRAANPQILAVDEITKPEDLQVMAHAANCGVALIATIHAGSKEELISNPLCAELVKMKVFSRAVAIRCTEGKRCYEVQHL